MYFTTFKLHFFPKHHFPNPSQLNRKTTPPRPHLLHTFAQQSLITIAKFQSFINASPRLIQTDLGTCRDPGIILSRGALNLYDLLPNLEATEILGIKWTLLNGVRGCGSDIITSLISG